MRKIKPQTFDRKLLSSLEIHLDEAGKSYELCSTEGTKMFLLSLNSNKLYHFERGREREEGKERDLSDSVIL